MKNMVYIQSGGPTSVINTSLYGAIKEAKKHKDQIGAIYGSQHGIEGLIYDDLIDLGKEDDEQIELLLQTPGSILGTTRRKLPKDIHDPVYMDIVNNLKKHNIGYVFVNGGNDSMDTCNKIAKLVKELGLTDIKVIGVPKTIDNDLACTDHSLGFPSAAKYVINSINAFAMDANCFMVGKVHVVEIMGRNAGWLTASVDLLPEQTRPDLIYIPENKFDLEKFLVDVKKVYDKRGFALVAISEGIDLPQEGPVKVDGFGHAQLGGAASKLCSIIESRTDLRTRAIEFSIVQRAFPAYVSLTDRKEAIKTGEKAVQAALKGRTGKMVIFERVSTYPYKIKFKLAPLSKVANAESRIPASMMVDDTRMSQEFRDYLFPLVQGEVKLTYKDGIAPVANLKRIKVK